MVFHSTVRLLAECGVVIDIFTIGFIMNAGILYFYYGHDNWSIFRCP